MRYFRIQKNRKILLLVFSICLFLFAPIAKAELPPEELFINQPNSTNRTATLPQWQSITIPEGIENISKVYLRLGSAGATATLGLSLSPTCELIDSRIINVNTGSYYNFAWFLFDFSDAHIPVEENSFYYLRLSYTGATMKYYFSTNNPYAGGRLQMGSNNDFMMRLYSQPPEINPLLDISNLIVLTIKENTIGIISANILQIVTLGLVIFCIMLIVKLFKKFD